jgi:hypothetical protein
MKRIVFGKLIFAFAGCIAIGGLGLFTTTSLAHHSVGAFYDNQVVAEIDGIITRVRWVNPHVRLTVESSNQNGESVTWEIESGAVNFLERDGVSRSDVVIGEQVRVVGYASRHGRNEMVASYITLPSGQSIVLWPGLLGGGTTAGLAVRAESPSETDVIPAANGARHIFRVWSVGRDSSGRAGDGGILPITAAARAAQAEYDPLIDDTALRCIPQGMPGIMDNPFPMEIAEQGEDILIRTEEWDVERTIHMNSAVDADNPPATPLGYSVGRWDGESLVVSTSNIDWPYYDDIGTPMTQAMEIIERYTLSEDESRLDMTMTVTDSATFTEPVHLPGAYWTWVPGETIKPYNCTL